MKRFTDLVNDCLPHIAEDFPWDVEERLGGDTAPLIIDIREPGEFDAMHIDGSLNVPRGILESACDWGYEETEPQLASARQRDVVLVCRSGNRSALAAHTLQLMGYRETTSMKTGLRGWNDYELPLVDKDGRTVPVEEADEYFTTRLRPDQVEPGSG
jgi:rhodanese-related sulfurtransferase